MNPSVLLSGAGWTPRRLPTLLAWYDSTIGVTQSAGAVSQWDDQSGNNFHLTQSSASNKPTYGATSWNGSRPGITFAATNYLQNTTSGFADYPSGTNRPISVFATLNTTKGADRFLAQWTNAVPNQFFGFWFKDDTDPAHPLHLVCDVTAGGSAPTGTIDASGAKRVAFITAATATTYVDSALDLNGVSFGTTITTLGKFFLGINALGAAPYVGTIAEIVMCSSVRLAAEFAAYRGYSVAKFGG